MGLLRIWRVKIRWQHLQKAAAVGWVVGVLGAAGSGPTWAVEVDASVPVYERVGGVSGNLSAIGSDTLNNLMTLWAEGFNEKYPNVNIQIEGKGSATAPPALISGTAQLGPMSRAMKQEELDAFERRFGYPPTAIRVAVDALAIFAHRHNPIEGLTLAQVDGIFSATRRLGAPEDIRQWGQLGLPLWEGRRISLYGRNSASGTYGYFKQYALGKGDFKNHVKEQPGSSAVVQGVSSDEFALGYTGVGYLTSGVRYVALGSKPGEYFMPTYENCVSGRYPMSRFLLIYVNKPPGRGLSKLVEEFMKFVLSVDGQRMVLKDGYYPLPAQVITETMGGLRR